MKLVDMVCPHCGAHLQVNAESHQADCEHCGAALFIDDEVRHIQYDNAEEAGYKFEKGRQRAQAEVNRSYNNVKYTAPVPKKKRRTWLWVLGWIFIFPLPLTILLLRKKDMKPALKYGIIAVAWILYFVIVWAGGSSDNNGADTRTSTQAGAVSSNITGLSFTRTDNITLKVGESYSDGYVKADVRRNSDFSSDDVIFVSDNPDVATISLTKVSLSTYLYYEIVAVGPGETNVYVTSLDGSVVSETINVTVPEPIRAENITINDVGSELVLGDTVALALTFYPENAEDKSITWSSSDEAILQVDEKGNVHAIGGGTATITASTSSGISDSIGFNIDGSKRNMSLRVTHPRQDDINIGDEWSYITEVNGEHASGSYTVSVGDTLQFYAKFTESDDSPDVGEVSTSYTVTEKDLINGFTVSMDLYVTENGGRNSGKTAHFLVTFTFTPK